MHPLVSVEWLNENLNDRQLIILDGSIKKVQSGAEAEIQDQRIVGARFFDLKGIFSDAGSALPNMLPPADVFARACRKLGINRDSKIVVYDTLGIYSSPRVWWMFKTMGHEAVAVLDGGLPAWISQNYPTEPITEQSFSPGDFEANYQPNLTRNVEEMVQNLDKPEAIVVDARSTKRFHGQAPEPRKSLKGGHIPQSLNLPYDQVLRDGQFRSKEELATIIGNLKLGDQPLIFTCGSGITACIIMLACELIMENEKAVYDGSWSEWGISAKGFPIEV